MFKMLTWDLCEQGLFSMPSIVKYRKHVLDLSTFFLLAPCVLWIPLLFPDTFNSRYWKISFTQTFQTSASVFNFQRQYTLASDIRE